MAQVGRISGALLEANLLRQGIANGTQQNLSFKNSNSDTTLLKVDVANGRIGVDVEAPANELQISQTTQTIDLIADTANIGNFNMSNTDINVDSGNIFLNASEAIVLSNLETEQFFVTDNYISTNNTNTDIDLKFNGTGELIIPTNLEVFGNLHAGGNVTFDGNITFGDADTDTIDFNADVVDSLIPDVTDTYDLGSTPQRWKTLNTSLVNGQLLTTGQVNVDGIFLESRQGNIFYVAKLGDDTNAGDHPNGPLLTIQEALARCDASTDGPVTILVYPGVYEETCPLVVPDRVSIRGVDIRNVVIKPTVATQDKDIFHLGDSCLITNLTIKDYFYNSIDNTGYAFRFTPNAVITNRSPYVQDITVITKGSVTSASDPRGFDEGDAGRGAWIDGAELNSASIEASFLFHSATFICPNADVINMTNGVRVEWLNSFTYFANRGLYAFNGITGRTTHDGSTVQYGAELRSISSANVYGNYGAVADGADTLMYLIQHNMGYIGAGKFVDNDASRAIYENEIVELNSGTIHFTTTDHLGGFRIGDNFFVDFETGNTTINIDSLSVNQFNALRVNTGGNTTVIDGSFVETGNLTIANNIIQSNTGDLNLNSATSTINLQDNTNITGNLDITGNFSYGGTLNIKGDEATDALTFNTFLDQDFNPHQHQTFKLGSFEKKWLVAHLNRLEVGDYSIYDNVIETNTSNANVELRANGTGLIYIPSNNVTFSNSMTVNGSTSFTDFRDIATLVHTLDNPNAFGTSQGDQFGVSVAISGNYAIVGANLEDDAGTDGLGGDDSGKAYIFDVTTGALLHTLDNPSAYSSSRGDRFGWSVAISGDRAIVSAPNEDDTGGGLSGKAYIFDVITGSLLHTLDNPNAFNTSGGDRFGWSVAISGDRAIAGAPNEDDAGGDFSGKAYIFNVTDGNLLHTLDNPNAVGISDRDQFGESVAISGNYAIIGVESEEEGGKAYVFDVTTGSLLYTLDNPNTDEDGVNDSFGCSVSISGDRAIVGARSEDDEGGTNSGTAYIFDTQTGSLVHTLDNPNAFGTSQGDQFGFTVAISGDRAIVGAIFEDDASGTSSGKAYIFDVTTGSLLHTLDHPNSFDTSQNDRFSESLAISENNAIVGTRFEGDVGGTSSGKAYIFNVTATSTPTDTNITGTYTHTGDTSQTGNFSVSGDVTVNQNLTVGASADFEEISVDNNFITTTRSNADLELRASGTGTVNLQETVNVANNLTARETTATNANITLNATTDNASIGNVEINDNHIETTSINGDLTLVADRNVVVTGTDVNLAQNLTVQGTTNLQALDVTGTLVHTGAYNQTGNYIIGGELTVDSVYVEDNFITTTSGDLTLEASGTGTIFASSNNVSITNNLDVDGVANLDVTNIDGTVVHTGDRIQTGNYILNGELIVDNVYIEDNFITTTVGNLTLGGTGDINVDTNNVEIAQNLNVSGATNLQNTTITGTITHVGDTTQTGNYDIAGEISNGNIVIEDNFISTTNTNSDLELRASGTGEVVIDSDDTVTIENNLFVGGTLDYQGSLTINGDVTLQGNVQDGSLTVTEDFEITGTLDVGAAAQFEEILVDDNFITTTSSNANLELRASGTGEVLIPNNNVQVNNNLFTASISTGNITVNNDLVINEIVIPPSIIEIDDNFISTKVSNADLELRANGNGNVVVQENTIIEQNLTVSGNTNLQNTTITGAITHTGNRTQTGNYVVNGGLTAGLITLSRPLQVGDIKISGNVLETTVSNSDLDLRAAGTGQVKLENSVDIQNNLSVRNLNVDSINVANSVDLEVIELSTDVQFEDNVITTTNSNSNLELRAAGTGKVFLSEIDFKQSSIGVAGSGVDSTLLNITFAPTEDLVINSDNALVLPKGTTLQRIISQDEFLDGGAALNSGTILDGGDAATIFGAGDTIYNSGGAVLQSSGNTGDIRFNTDDNVFEGTSISTVTFNGVYSTDRQTNVTADPTSNNIRFVINGAASPLDSSNLVGEVTGEGLTIHGMQVDDILVDNNIITTNVSNSDLDLSTNGSGELVLDDLSLKNNLIKNNGNNLIIKSTGFGHAKIAGTYGVVIPNGTTVTPTPDPQIGDTRWNTSSNQLETWDGTTYVVSTGTQAAISQDEFDDLLLEYTIIFG